MIVVLLVGGGSGWLVQRAHIQRDAVAAIERAGGSVAYDWQWSDGMPILGQTGPPGPGWLHRLLGPDFLGTVAYVRLQGSECGDEALLAACRLPHLEELIVLETSVTDVGAEELYWLKHLRILDFRLNRTSPRPLRHIGVMSEMRDLKLAMNRSLVPLRDGDLTFLSRLPRLQRLMLPGDHLTDKFLVHLKELKDLESLMLYDTAITSEGLRNLGGLSKLASLSLHGSRVTDLSPLDPLRSLNYLCLAYTPIGDPGLVPLRSWDRLRTLDLRQTGVSDEALMDLGRANPLLKVNQ